MKSKTSKWIVCFIFLSLVCLVIGTPLFAQPDTPPPAGKVWVKGPNGWVLVPAPPADAPYVWVKDHWEKITEIPPGKVWVPPHWGKNGWVPGHWRLVTYPYKGARWVPGHWTQDGRWIPGHWNHRVPPPPHRKRRIWVPGHRAPNGRWIPGHWR